MHSFLFYINEKAKFLTLRRFFWLIVILIGAIVLFVVYRMVSNNTIQNLLIKIDYHFWLFVLAGFVAQLIDGALGMAYGVSCSSMLIAFNVPPVISTASVHISEVFTTGISGLSHLKFKNVHRELFMKLLIPGILGAGLGAYLISEYFDGRWIKPVVSTYLMILGLLILRKAIFAMNQPKKPVVHVRRLAFAGGFLDAVGGGGWGPIVVTNLIHQGANPKRTIGSANTAEFFISLMSSAVFIYFIKISNWQPVIGIMMGGIVAAPLAALLLKIIKPKPLMIIVGFLIFLVSLYNIYSSIPVFFEKLITHIF
jgi:uncharacterized membrane protein YfcA